jgi:type IV pilus assembly protein PilP
MKIHLLQRNSPAYAAAVLIVVASLVSACNKKEQPVPVVAPSVPLVVQQQAKAVQKQISSTAIKLPAAPTGNQFDFSGKKDPFKPDVSLKTTTAPSQADIKKAMQGGLPIHSFDVSQFKLIGVVTGAKENQAMVVDPNGKGYVLKTGMTIGKNDGRITAVNINGVDVVEQFKDDNGRVRKENIRITLPRKQ